MATKLYSYTMVPTIRLLGGQNYLPEVPHLDQLKALISEYGMVVPIIISEDYQILSGCEQMLAACSLGRDAVPCLYHMDLYPCDLDHFRQLAHEQLTSYAWDEIAAKVDDPDRI